MVYQVGSPAMFDGNMFLPDTGTPIWKIERSRTRLAVWLPDPLTVATWMLKSLTIAAGGGWARPTGTATSLGDMELLRGEAAEIAERCQIIYDIRKL